MTATLRRGRGWRALLWFWCAVLLVGAAGAGTLQFMASRPSAPPAAPAAPEAAHAPLPAATTAPAVRVAAGPVASPDPALSEPAPGLPGARLPRIGADGRLPMRVYAGASDPAERRPLIGLVLAGLGLNEADSAAAIAALPAGVTLAISPYAASADATAAAARQAGHELLASIPLEPQGYPLNDAGNQTLLTGAPPEENLRRLRWALSRFGGYAGATGALDGMRGERLAALPEQFSVVLTEVGARGLLYIDPRPGAPDLPLTGRAVDLVVDDPPLRASIESRLARLEQIARERGSALGLAGPVRPVTTEILAAWARGLAGRELALVPVSALVRPPKAAEK